jgi:hypothetical protein
LYTCIAFFLPIELVERCVGVRLLMAHVVNSCADLLVQQRNRQNS